MIIAVILFSFLIGAISSILGLHSDTAAVISESIRINSGQLNFYDYSIHFPLITATILAFLAKILGITGAFIFLSGILNSLYAYIIYKIANKINSSHAICVACVGASWFIPTIGGYYYDNLAVVIGFLQFYIVLSNNNGDKLKNIYFGLLCALGLMVKHSSAIAMIVPALLYFVLTNFNKNFLRQCFYIIIGLLIGLTLVVLYLEFMNTGYAKRYFNELYEASAIYAKNTGRLSIKNFINVFFFPYNINIFLFKNISMGVLLFSPVVIIQYLFYFSYFSLRKKGYLNFYLYTLFATLLTEFIIGRGSLNLTYFLPLQLLCIFQIKKYL